MDPISVIKLASLAKSVAEFLGIIESQSNKIDKLSKAELNAGIRTLKQVDNSYNEKEALLREARNCFNKAISLEKNERLIIALSGLSLCHSFLGDDINSRNVYSEIAKAKYDINVVDTVLVQKKEAEDTAVDKIKSPFLKEVYVGIFKKSPLSFFVKLDIGNQRAAFVQKKIEKFENFKKESLVFLEKII